MARAGAAGSIRCASSARRAREGAGALDALRRVARCAARDVLEGLRRSSRAVKRQPPARGKASAGACAWMRSAAVERLARDAQPTGGIDPALIDYFRAMWSKVRTEQQYRQSLDQVPRNAGPLNSNSLVHRSLATMRELSPEYLQQFLSYIDALAWLEDLAGGGAQPEKEAPRAKAAKTLKPAKKTTRTKAR
ncbi:DUF2894 domain-containing protein [Burkholderia sp. USMB20]|uniref:DUF2894 domain-containing protein n=1 Tax=Burkholderia sp. USMB20 TaxID=1571773 RepID=UPI002E275446